MVDTVPRNGNFENRILLKTPTWRGLIDVRLFCREIDSDYSRPPAFPFRVLYSSQPRDHGFRLPDRERINQQQLLYAVLQTKLVVQLRVQLLFLLMLSNI